MTRRLLNVLTPIAALLCVAVCVLWVRSRVAVDRISVSSSSGRYTVRTAAGRFVLFGPPARGIPGTDAAALASQVRNDQIVWLLAAYERDDGTLHPSVR